MISFLKKNKQKCITLLWVATVLVSIKSIFTDLGTDNTYTVAMAFRHLKGDRMFDPMEFLLTDAKISNPSVINTPIYNEKLLDYLELYPQKRPAVVYFSWYPKRPDSA